MCISYLTKWCLSQSVKESMQFSHISLSNKSHAHELPFFNRVSVIISVQSNTAQSVQLFSGDELEAWFKPEEIWFASVFCTQWTLIWCITDVLKCSGSPQPQNYTAAVGFRCNWLGSILDDTIRAASKQNGIGYKKLNNLAHNMNPSISPKSLNQMHSL